MKKNLTGEGKMSLLLFLFNILISFKLNWQWKGPQSECFPMFTLQLNPLIALVKFHVSQDASIPGHFITGRRASL